MHLPQELVDYIIDLLHDNPTTLAQLSLVSRAWVSRARVHLCETMVITRPKLLSSNLAHLTPLCEYTKILHLAWLNHSTNPSAVLRLLDCFEQSEPHTLAVHSCDLHRLDEQTIRRCFAKFPCTSITTLELHDISTTQRTFLVLLSSFPNVDDLSISVNRCWDDRLGPGQLGSNDNEILQPTSPHFKGSFKFSDPLGHGVYGYARCKLLRTIALFPLQFQTVSLDTKEQSWEDALIFLHSCSKTTRRMFVNLAHGKYQVMFHATQSRALSV